MSTPPKEEEYRAHVGSVARGAGISTFGQGVSRVLGYATQIAIARMYGPTQLGFYVLGTTMIAFANVISQVGMDNGVVRYVAHYRTERDASRIRGTILFALWLTFGLSLVVDAHVDLAVLSHIPQAEG